MTVAKGINSLVREVVHADEAYTAELLERGKLKHRKICEAIAVYNVFVLSRSYLKETKG